MIDDGFIEWVSKYNRHNPVMDTAHIADGAVTAPKLLDSAVTTPKIQDLAVAEGKLADGAVTAIKLAADSVTSAKIAARQVVISKLNIGLPVYSLPADAYPGDVCLYQGFTNAAWLMVAGDVYSSKRRWYPVGGGASIFYKNETFANISTSAFTDIGIQFGTGPYTGLWRTTYTASFDDNGTGTASDIHLYLTRDSGTIAVQIAHGSLVGAWSRPTISSTYEHPTTAGGNLTLYARGFAGSPRTLLRNVKAECLYLDVPLP